jgi:sortase A
VDKTRHGEGGMGWLGKLERLLLIFGVLMLALYAAAWIHRATLSDAELLRFKSRQLVSAGESQGAPLSVANPDISLWSKQRISGYRESLAAHFAPAIAVLRIFKIQLEVPVLEGTDELSLNRGVGHVAGTGNSPGNTNTAIAGHRDGFFRRLKDIAVGDTIEMDTIARTETFVVDRIIIVDPTDVSVLQPRPRASLTLITCYPFYFVGSAPKRFIVEASVPETVSTNASVNAPQSKFVAVEQQNETVSKK